METIKIGHLSAKTLQGHIETITIDKTICVCGKIPKKICPCNTVKYCSKECQLKDWSKHKKYASIIIIDLQKNTKNMFIYIANTPA